MLKVDRYSEGSKRKLHVERVVDLCKKFVAGGVRVDEDLLLDAAVLHDVAKELDKKVYDHNYHQERKYIALALHEKNRRVDRIAKFDDVCIVIENHRGVFFPHKYVWESAILRICDKLDKFNKAEEMRTRPMTRQRKKQKRTKNPRKRLRK